MSNYLRWTKHPETGAWHHAYWIDDCFGHHHYGVSFNDDKTFDVREYELETVSDIDEIPDESIIDTSRDRHSEIFGIVRPVEYPSLQPPSKYKNYEVLGSRWWTPPVPSIIYSSLCIGAVAIESFEDGLWKVYIGFGSSNDEAVDSQYIARLGMPIGSKEAAHGLFPQFDVEKFRY
jgi:hypothetical protein